MDIKALAAQRRDVRIDLFRGIANWFIFLDHIPNNVVNWITIRNFGFSGAADLFIFISGYAAAIVYAKMRLERGFVVGATRIFKRVWQLYVAYIILFVIYIVTIADVAATILPLPTSSTNSMSPAWSTTRSGPWPTGCCCNPGRSTSTSCSSTSS